MHQPKVDLALCSPLNEQITPDSTNQDRRYPLPADFPRKGLSDDQLDTITTWWNDWTQDMLTTIRKCLTAGSDVSPTLDNFTANAAALANLLGLHPACDGSVTKLAAALQTSHVRMLNARQLALKTLTHQRHIPANIRPPHPTIKQLHFAFPQLAWNKRRGKHPVILVPFAQRTLLVDQWDTVLSLSLYKGVTATLDLLDSTTDAVRITFTGHPAAQKNARAPRKRKP